MLVHVIMNVPRDALVDVLEDANPIVHLLQFRHHVLLVTVHANRHLQVRW